MRNLASIQTVVSTEPIPGADRVEKIRVLGWTLVAGKGQFAPGARCVYFEIDSILPDRPEFEFMRPRKFRLKTVKLRGVLSQGLAMPLATFPELSPDLAVGTDVTELLKVAKWEPPLQMATEAEGPFPPWLPKTDEVRIQSAPQLVDELRGKRCYVTVKMDGTSATYARRGDEFKVCSRGLALRDSADSLYYGVMRRHRLDEKLRALPGNFAVQGELCGPKIQSNRAGLKTQELFVFNVWDLDRGAYLDYADFAAFCRDLELQTVPLVSDDLLFDHTLEQLLDLADGDYPGTKHPREGIVIRPLVETFSPTLPGRLSFKVINNRFLLHVGE